MTGGRTVTAGRTAPPAGQSPAGGGGGSTGGRPDRRRRVPAWAATLLLGISAAVLVLVALLAGRAGPLVAHPPTAPPRLPPTQSAPTLTMPTMPSLPPQQQQQPSGAWLWWVAAVIGAMVVIFLVLALVRALRRPGRITAPPLAPPGAPLSPMGLSWLDEEPEADLTDDRTFDPHRAADDIIASWTATESAAARLGLGRQPSSTPTEFLASLTERFGDPGLPGDGPAGSAGDGAPPVPGSLGAPDGARRAAGVLLALYHRARFDTTALAPGAATTARRAARALISAWGPEPHHAHHDNGGHGDDGHDEPGGDR